MIRDIKIENFRCFEHTKIEGFERVNLIGGKNNSGKTALLEAILLNQSPQPETIFLLRKFRQELSIFTDNHHFDLIWSNLFFNYSLDYCDKTGSIVGINYNNHQQIVKYRSNACSGINSFSNHLSTKKLEQSLDQKKYDDFMLSIKVKLAQQLSFKNDNSYIANINEYNFIITSNTEEIEFRIGDSNQGTRLLNNSILSIIIESFNIEFLPYPSQLSFEKLVKDYSLAALNRQDDALLNILSKIDPEIEEIRIYNVGNIGDAMLYIKTYNKNFLPITMFGDAIKRVTEIILSILNYKSDLRSSNIILIDEIENGIHYTNHRDFWKALFELSKELDVQIFATTHSLEMIQAFRDIGLNYYADSGAYFEMARNPRTNKIVGIKHELEMLDYALKRSEGVRGE